MNRYNINQNNFGTHKLITEELGSNNLILDVGCNKGYLKKISPDNTFYGIDFDKKDLEIAKQEGYSKVFFININDPSGLNVTKKFDIIVFADILEHLVYPEKVLSFFVKNYLKEKGKIIISLPNIANISIRVNLLIGNFNYAKSGILDETHLHLYTLSTARKLISSSNLTIIKQKFSSNRLGKYIKFLPFLGGLLGYNLIFICKNNKSNLWKN